MTRKSLLPLMEQLIMVLVFTVAAAFCIQGFVLSDRISHRFAAQDQAVLLAESAADTLKSFHGDYADAAKSLGGTWDGSCWQIPYNSSWQPDSDSPVYFLTASPALSGQESMGKARIIVTAADGCELFSLTVAWQEVSSFA